MTYGPTPAAYLHEGVYVIACPKCSGTGLLTDDAAFQRQVCSTDEDCATCTGSGRVPYKAKSRRAS